MPVSDIFKISRKTFINPSNWLDYEGLKQKTLAIYQIFNDFINSNLRPEVEEESFKDAMARLNVSEEDLINTLTNYNRLTVLFFLIGVLLLGYAFFLLFNYNTFWGWILGIVACLFSLSVAFRYSFWALQISQRKLGLTFVDWKNHILGNKETK